MLRNKEYRRFVVCFFVIAVAFTAAGFLINRPAGLLAVLSAFVFGILFYVFTRASIEVLRRFRAD